MKVMLCKQARGNVEYYSPITRLRNEKEQMRIVKGAMNNIRNKVNVVMKGALCKIFKVIKVNCNTWSNTLCI